MGDPAAKENQPAAHHVRTDHAAGQTAQQAGKRRMGQKPVLKKFVKEIHKPSIELQSYAFFSGILPQCGISGKN